MYYGMTPDQVPTREFGQAPMLLFFFSIFLGRRYPLTRYMLQRSNSTTMIFVLREISFSEARQGIELTNNKANGITLD